MFKGFLLAPHIVGNDEQYAAAMAVLANRVGVPARVVVGAVVPPNGKVRGDDVEAWVEVRVADGSWRTLPTDNFMSNRPPRPGMPPAPRPSMPTGPVAEEPTTVPTVPELAIEEQAREEADAGRRTALVRLLPWLVPSLLALVVPLTKLARRGLRRRRGRPSDRMAGAWAELVDHARDLGIPVKVQARDAPRRESWRAGAVAREGDEGVFAEKEPTEAAVAAYWEQVTRERHQLGVSQPVRRRLWAPFNPVTLVRRPGTD